MSNDSLIDQFDPSVNTTYGAQQDLQSSLVSDVLGGTVATVADFGASVWNSLPGTEEVDTADLLSRVSTNALRVYEEHPDLIHTASFIGGMFVPAGLAMKGMRALRAGAKGASWFSDAGKASKLAELDNLFAQGSKATAEYRAMRNGYLARGVANNLLDSYAVEGAIMASMNAHPFMEDYMQNPVSNFLLWGGVGGVIGGGIGMIGDNYLAKFGAGKLETEAFDVATKDYITAPQGSYGITKLQIRENNIKNLEAIAAKPDLNSLTKEIVGDMLLGERAAQIKEFDEVAKKSLVEVTPEVRDTIIKDMVNRSEFASVDSMDFLRLKDSSNSLVTGLPSNEAPEFITKKGATPGVVYYPEFGSTSRLADSQFFARASALNVTESSLKKALSPIHTRIPQVDTKLVIETSATAETDKLYLASLAHIDGLSEERLAKAVFSPEDLPGLQAVLARAYKDPSQMAGKTVKLAKELPTYDAINKEILQTAGGHVSPTHIENIKKLLTPEHNILEGLEETHFGAAESITQWIISPSSSNIRAAFDQYFRGAPPKLLNKELIAQADAIYNSSASKAFRSKLEKLADTEGNIYLYRGASKELRTHYSVESFTPNYKGAQGFGDVKLYKVPVKDVIGYIRAGVEEFEILVTSPTRIAAATLPTSSTVAQKIKNPALREMSVDDLLMHVISTKADMIKEASKQGLPVETIAIRTNTPVDTVEAFISSGDTHLLPHHGPIISYSAAKYIKEYLSPLQRPLVLKSNINKQNYLKLTASLDQRATQLMNREIVDATLKASNSFTAKNFHKEFIKDHEQLLDIMRAQVSNAVNKKAGNKFFTSTDFYTRDMGDFGKLSTFLGKRIQAVANATEKKLLPNITDAMNTVAKDEVALLEINTALAHNAELQGPRFYKDRQFWQKAEVVNAEGEKVTQLVPTKFRGEEYKVVSDSVDKLLTELNVAGRELYSLGNTINKTLGKPALNDLGFWVPAFNPKGKFISYVWDKLTDSTRILWGNTADELTNAEKVFGSAHAAEIEAGTLQIVPKSQQGLYNTLSGRTDALTMDFANVEKLHSGASAPAIIKFNTDVFSEIAGGYQHYINSRVKQLAEISLHDITDVLDRMSVHNKKYFSEQPLGILGKLRSEPEDSAVIMKNTLLGNSNLHEYSNWKSMNQSFETVMNWGIDHMSSAFKAVKGSKIKGGIDYEELAKKAERAGIVNPFASYDNAVAQELFGVAKLTEAKNVASRLVHASNGLAATLALRVGELAQPIVNAMSLPILTTSAIMDRMPATFLGKAKGTARINPVGIMYDGARAMNSPLYKKLNKEWEAAGYYEPFVSEATEILKQARQFEPGILAKVESGIESNLVELLSKGSTWSETFVRKMTMHTGAVLAKRLYPELDDAGVTIFARNFMDQAVGNYHASQRPVFFQGTLGTAMGLFQTYMLTLGQSMYRHLELKNYKALGATMLAQNTIFGSASLPGFHVISEQIGKHFSDDNVDLTTGTFRALGDDAASLLLYGLPSNLGPAFYTRGDVSPRVPTGPGAMPQVNMLVQTIGAAGHVLGALGSDYPDIARTMGEALTMQSMSRPLARGAELALGYSTTGAGATVSTPEEVWTATGIISRVLGTRPLEEAKLREAIHLDRIYQTADHEERQKAIKELKTAIRAGTLTDTKLSKIAEEYMRTGTPQGWRAARNQAIGQTEVSGKTTIMQKLHPNNPLNFMIDQWDGV